MADGKLKRVNAADPSHIEIKRAMNTDLIGYLNNTGTKKVKSLKLLLPRHSFFKQKLIYSSWTL